MSDNLASTTNMPISDKATIFRGAIGLIRKINADVDDEGTPSLPVSKTPVTGEISSTTTTMSDSKTASVLRTTIRAVRNLKTEVTKLNGDIERKDLLISIAQKSIQQLGERLDELKQELHDAKASEKKHVHEIEGQVRQVAALKDDISSLEQQFKTKDEMLSRALQDITEADKAFEQSEAQRKYLGNKFENDTEVVNRELADLKAQLRASELANQQLSMEATSYKQQLSIQGEELATAYQGIENLKQIQAEQSRVTNEFEAHLNASRKQHVLSMLDVKDKAKRLGLLGSEMNRMTQDATIAKDEASQKESELVKTKKFLSTKSEEVVLTQKELSSKIQELNVVKKRLSRKEVQFDVTQKELVEANDKIAGLTSHSEQEVARLRTSLNTRNQEFQNLQAQHENISTELQSTKEQLSHRREQLSMNFQKLSKVEADLTDEITARDADNKWSSSKIYDLTQKFEVKQNEMAELTADKAEFRNALDEYNEHYKDQNKKIDAQKADIKKLEDDLADQKKKTLEAEGRAAAATESNTAQRIKELEEALNTKYTELSQQVQHINLLNHKLECLWYAGRDRLIMQGQQLQAAIERGHEMESRLMGAHQAALEHMRRLKEELNEAHAALYSAFDQFYKASCAQHSNGSGAPPRTFADSMPHFNYKFVSPRAGHSESDNSHIAPELGSREGDS